ncbi:MAG: protein phosphatase 2C domain-containing protein [Paracoccaceae bacterium]|nr:protein phosphatase 2C domain-containing protein [Paracoccaceae bacterium]
MRTPTTRIPGQTAQPLRFDGTGATHRGYVRDLNEDAILLDPSGAIWAVVDGMGGMRRGDLAAEITTEALAKTILSGDPAEDLWAALEVANTSVLEIARAEGSEGMGATVVAFAQYRGHAAVVWAGDSRGYVLRAGYLQQLTKDHSVVQSLLDRGLITPVEAETHPEAHVVTQAIGVVSPLVAEMVRVEPAPSDRYLLCSDGLSGVVCAAEIAAHLEKAGDPGAAVDALIAAALAAGAPDNVSVVVIDVRAG